ncbi:hypothetical protein BGZ65_002131 [Modicella reniformis]|uniref:Uncharacterized protein n=1 Tax=Modicella reniformis TaxID=1440133 RepID=A0A9P6LTC0_9FUNG|nr:hypothetical protein BGZ65_002131 [Modicella reniformis]
MSLSPPPRQSWARSKSFQGTNSAITAALQFKADTNDSYYPVPITVDTKLANERSGSSTADKVSSSDEPRTSMSSSLGSATSGSLSPALNSISELHERSGSVETDHRFSSKNLSASPTSPPLSPLATPVMRLGSLKTRNPEYRTNSLDRESHSRILNNAGARDRTGFSTAAMDLRRANSRYGRSGDNGDTFGYYRNANTNDHGSTDREREHGLSTTPSNPTIHPPSSPHIVSSGFSYYGVSSTGEDSGRSSPTPYATRDGQSYYSAGSSSYIPQHYQKTKTSLDLWRILSLEDEGQPGTIDE